MSTILSRWPTPSSPLWTPGCSRALFRRLASALYSVSMISVLLPLPDTPVTQVKVPSGILAVTFCRLFSLAPLTVSQRPFLGGGGRRSLGIGIRSEEHTSELQSH